MSEHLNNSSKIVQQNIELNGRPLGVLMFGSSQNVASLRSDVIGGAQYRLEQYSEQLGYLDAIIRTFRSQAGLHTQPYSLTPKTSIYPTYSINRLTFWLDAYRIGVKLIADGRFQVIAVQDASLMALVALALRWRYDIPISVTIYGDHIDNPGWLREGIAAQVANWLSKWVLRRADSIRVDSNYVKKRLIDSGISSQRIYSYPVFIRDLADYIHHEGDKVRERWNIGTRPSILFVGRLVPQKNIPNLLRALEILVKQLPQVRCLIVGDGPEENMLRDLTRQMGLDDVAIFVGAIEYKELRDYYGACNVMVLPSNYEGIARVLIEASAAERPIVATCVGGTPEIVDDGTTGYLVNPDDPEGLAAALAKLLCNPCLAEEMGQCAREQVMEDYLEENLIPKYLSVWLETAQRGVKRYPSNRSEM